MKHDFDEISRIDTYTFELTNSNFKLGKQLISSQKKIEDKSIFELDEEDKIEIEFKPYANNTKCKAIYKDEILGDVIPEEYEKIIELFEENYSIRVTAYSDLNNDGDLNKIIALIFEKRIPTEEELARIKNNNETINYSIYTIGRHTISYNNNTVEYEEFFKNYKLCIKLELISLMIGIFFQPVLILSFILLYPIYIMHKIKKLHKEKFIDFKYTKD